MCRIFREAGRFSGVCILFLLTFFANSCIDEELGCLIPDGNPLVKESIVDRGDMHLAFPTITGNKDGSKLLIAYREGNTHISFDGRIVQKESYDKGKTWVNRKVIYQSTDPNGDARDPQFLTLPDGRVVCRFFERSNEQQSTVKMIVTNDWGQNYSFFGDIPAHSPKESYAAARGNMLLRGETVYTSMYNRWHDSWLMRSPDLGKTWEFVSWLNRSDGSLYGLHRQLNESSLCLQDNIMFMIARGGYDQPIPLTIAESLDSGTTWENWGDLGVCGHSPSLTPYKDSYILTYRNINMEENKDSNIHFDCALFSKGQLISKPFTILKSKSSDIGYGDVFIYDDFFLVCCYTHHSIHCFTVLYDVFEEL